MADLIAHRADQAVDAVGLFGALRDVPLEHESGLVAASGDNRLRRHEHARAGNDALIHGLLQLDVRILRAFCAEVSDRGEAGHERRAEMIRRAGHAQREALARDLIGPRCLVVRVEQHVRVPFDEARHERGSRQIDDLCAHRCHAGVRSGRVDAFAFHAHRPAVVHRVAVEDAGRLEHGDCRGGRVLTFERRERSQRHGGREHESRVWHAAL